jgi:two-component system, chemotaxis family, CheB/CheR fusion protein
MYNDSASPETLNDQDHYIIAIGASAGGLEAIHEFFDNMPAGGNFSFVIIQHLSADYKSLLVELVSKHTKMKVFEAKHDTKLEPDCVYVIPNDKLLKIKDCRIQLSEKHFEKSPNTAIDTFLKSLADDQGSKAIAVILSGTGTDGTRGIEAIQQNGGMILVQDPSSAKFDGMPNSAIAAGYADFILSPEMMPEEIINYAKEKPTRQVLNSRPDEAALPEVMNLIHQHCGFDFHNYKTPTIIRRIMRRMNQMGKKKFSEYIEVLRTDAEECKILGKEFLIGVTKFFRDSAAFEIFENEVLPDVVRNKNDNEILKVWVTACSTGQEAYSIAIMINEQLRRVHKMPEVKIFATDIDIEAVEYASKGVYPAAALADMDPMLVQRYFEKQGQNYSIIPLIRKQIVFAKHNIIKDPPFIKNDIVTCRNMLIYMNNVLQRKVLSTLQYSLNTGGYLFLGPSEIPVTIAATLAEVSNKWKIYRKTGNEKFFQPHYDTTHSLKSTTEIRSVREQATAKELAEDFKSTLTEEFRYAAVYIDRNYEIKEAVGDFRYYLSLPQKIMSLNVLKMVTQEVSIALNTALRRVAKEGKKVTLNHIRMKNGNEDRHVNIYVKPAASNDGYFLIVFGESHETVFSKIPSTDILLPKDVQAGTYISELEDELKETRLNLQMAVESLETTNEELQSSNEELLSANEELQSSNEELQSLNEELHTLNTEHQLRIKELVELNDDLNNYFSSTEIGQVFVDRNLYIRKFNPAAVSLVNLIESDIGRPIRHISNNIKDESLSDDIQHVISTGSNIEKEVKISGDRIVLMRILPYVRQDKNVDGVVITFFDVTEFKELNSIVRSVFDSSLSAIVAFKSIRNNQNEIVDLKILAGNHATDKLFDKPSNDYINKSLLEEFPELLSPSVFRKCIEVIENDVPLHTEVKIDINKEPVWFELVACRMLDGVVITLTNINDKKLNEDKLRRNYHELMQARETLKVLNTNLEEQVAKRTGELATSEERFRLIANAANDIVWDWDLNSDQVWWSDNYYRIFGFSPTNPEVKTADFWMKLIHPEDLPIIKDKVEKAIHDHATWAARYRVKKHDGSFAIISAKGSVIQDESGKAYRMVGAMTDITFAEEAGIKLQQKNDELQRLIDEFKFVTDFMPQLVWATRPDGYHDFYNQRWYDYTGLTYEETKDKGWAEVLHPDDSERAWKVWSHSLQTGDPYEIEYRFRRHDGVYRWFLGRALPLKDDNGNIVKWFGTCTDIHDQRIMNDLLEQKVDERTRELVTANKELEVMNTELMQFASVASHDLKEPLRKIHIFGNIIKDRYLNENDGAADYMNRIINSSSRMTKLINDLLAYSRLSATHFFESIDLDKIIHEVISDLELLIQEKKAKVDIGKLPVIDAVPGQLRQVLQNIISNSLKFTHPGRIPHISVKSDTVNSCSFDALPVEKGNHCRITIRDNGIGFDEQYAGKIFTIFQRLHSREQYEGTGIGLAITKKIIDRHNGIIMAKSKEDEGTTFIIVLPLTHSKDQVHSPVSSVQAVN